MNFKRKRHPNARAGCKMCKPQKSKLFNDEKEIYHQGFGKLRRLSGAKQDMKDY